MAVQAVDFLHQFVVEIMRNFSETFCILSSEKLPTFFAAQIKDALKNAGFPLYMDLSFPALTQFNERALSNACPCKFNHKI